VVQPESGVKGAAWDTVKREGVRMLTVMVSAMIVAASLLYYWERQQQLAREEATGPPQAEKPVATSEADSTRSHAAAVAADADFLAEPREVATAAAHAAASHESRMPAASPVPAVPRPSAAGETKSHSSPRAAGEEGAKPAKDGDPKPAGTASDKSSKQVPSIAPRAASANRDTQEKYKRGLSEVRVAMSKRDLIGAKLQIRTIASLAQTPEQEAEIARLDVLIGHLREFWTRMAQAAAGLQPAQEFTVGNTPVIVVEAGATQVTLRSEGRNRTIPVKSLPRPLVDGIVQAGFPDNPSNKVLYGAFLAFDPQGDRQLARKLWQQAIDSGEKAQDLLTELDSASPTAGGRPGDLLDPIARADVPTDPAGLEKAERKVRAQFEVDYNLASAIPGKLKLAEKLAEAAGGADVALESRFVMLRDARDQAVAAGKPGLACEVIDRLGQFFAVEPLEMKVAAVEQVAKSARTSKTSKELAECALGLVEEAVQGGRLDAAARLAAVSISAAQRAKNTALTHDAQEAKQRVDEMSKKGAAGRPRSK